MESHNLLSLLSFQTCMPSFFYMWNTKEDLLKNVDKQTVLDRIDFHCIFIHSIESINGNQNCIVLKIFFCVPQKTDSHENM